MYGAYHAHVQAGAESIMRNVAKRMMNAEAVEALISWKMKIVEEKSRERGEAIMRRVGLRMANRELSDAYLGWHEKVVEAQKRERGEMLMRRVGARMSKKEMTSAWDAWCRNYAGNSQEMVSECPVA